MDTQYELGDRIRLLREAKDMTQAELGARIGLSQTSVAQIETGVTITPRRSTLQKLANFFQVSVEYITKGVSAKKLQQGYFEQLWSAIPQERRTPKVAGRFSIYARFSADGPDYRIEYRLPKGTHMMLLEWDGEDWDTVLAQCIADLYNPQ